MAEAVIAAIGYIASVGAVAVFVVTTIVNLAYSSYAQGKAERKARDAHNASLRDRYTMVRGTTEPKTLVLGRQRVSGPMFFVESFGPSHSTLVFCIAIAAHEIDAVEQIYFNDEPVFLDGPIGSTLAYVTGVQRRESFPIYTPSDSFTLQDAPTLPTPVMTAFVTLNGVRTQVTITSVIGRVVTVTGSPTNGVEGRIEITYRPLVPAAQKLVEREIYLTTVGGVSTTPIPGWYYYEGRYARYEYSTLEANELGNYASSGPATINAGGYFLKPEFAIDGTVLPDAVYRIVYSEYETAQANVRVHLGAPGQVADARLITSLPEKWTAQHVATGVAYIVVELNYNPDDIASVPSVSALVRGAKVFDPRTGLTAWSENPSLLLRHAATSPLCGNLSAASVDDADIIAAANVCDTLVTYQVGSQSVQRKKYTAGHVVRSGERPMDYLADLAQAMGGRFAFMDGKIRVKSGAYATPLQSLDDSWLTGENDVVIQPTASLADLSNTVVGRYTDSANDFKVVDFPRVVAAAYLAQDGREMVSEVDYNAVTYGPQAQQLASQQLRDTRQGLTVTLSCNMRAYACEMFDVILVTLPRFGWASKPFEVMQTGWSLDGCISMTLKETASSIYEMGASFPADDPAPNTRLQSPLDVPQIAGLVMQSGTAHLIAQADGTITSRLYVAWDEFTGTQVRNGGRVQVRWRQVGSALDAWQTMTLGGADRHAYITDVHDGFYYYVQARASTALADGRWSELTSTRVLGKTEAPATPATLTSTAVQGGFVIAWTASTELDYSHTVLRTGASWAAGTQIFSGTANKFTWLGLADGAYQIMAKHVDTSGNESTNAAFVTGNLLNGTNDLVLITSAGITVTGNTISRTDGGSGWNQQARSKDSHTGGAFVSAVIGGHGIMIGLNTDPDANNSYETIDFAIYPEVGGGLQSYESGTIYSLGTWVVGDLVSVTYDGAFVRYYKNGALLRQTAAMPGLQFFLDTSFGLSGSPWRNVRFAPFTNTNTGRGQNLIDASWWNPGIAPSSRWATNGETNAFTSSTLPDGSNGMVWRATETTGDGNNGGGWNVSGGGGNRFPVSADKTYLFACYIKGTSGTGTAYFGTSQDITICDLNTQTQNWNPYFGVWGHTGDGSWRLHVGWVYPAGMTGLVHGRAGVYDCKTGVKLGDGSSYNWNATVTSATTRAYQYYASAGATQEFCWPMVFLCDGSEPSIDDLLSMSMPSARNPITSTNVSTYIADATIGEAKILGTLNANKITAGTITSDRFALSTGQASVGSWLSLPFDGVGSPGSGGGYSTARIPQTSTFSVSGGGTLAGFSIATVTLPSDGATITASVSGTVNLTTAGNWSGPGAGEHTLFREIVVNIVRKLSPTVIQALSPTESRDTRKEINYLWPNDWRRDGFNVTFTVGSLVAGEYLLIINGEIWANEGAGSTPLHCLNNGLNSASFTHSMIVNYV